MPAPPTEMFVRAIREVVEANQVTNRFVSLGRSAFVLAHQRVQIRAMADLQLPYCPAPAPVPGCRPRAPQRRTLPRTWLTSEFPPS